MKMMTRLGIPLLLILIMGAFIVLRDRQEGHLTILTGNTAARPVEVEPGRYQGAQCGMTLQQARDSAQAIAPDGRTWFFDDVGCLALWLKDNRLQGDLVLWVFGRDTGDWLDARRAWYSRTDDTPMGYGFAAYSRPGETLVDFETMVDLMQRDEDLTNPDTRQRLLGNN